MHIYKKSYKKIILNKKTLTFVFLNIKLYSEEVTDVKTYIKNIIRPKIQGDGGEIVFLSQEDNIINVAMRGECSKCLILDRCIRWIEEQIKKDLGEAVTINAIRQKPFFWDT